MSSPEPMRFILVRHNPDVLTCIANLSSDEVFTPPAFADQMLDTLEQAWAKDHGGASIWENPEVTFLDPFTKSGVFLRQITERLVKGLEKQIPDLQTRVDHILGKQIYGIAITELTALLARRSLYCSRDATSTHSITKAFSGSGVPGGSRSETLGQGDGGANLMPPPSTPDDGHIWFRRANHHWVGATQFVETMDSKGRPTQRGTNGRCKYCSARQETFDRGDTRETHAYAFIHNDDPKAFVNKIFGVKMQFDVVIGNPPYQMAGGAGGTSDSSIYQLFVEQAQKLDPRMLIMVTPARWVAGGRGLGEFRTQMLSSKHLRNLVDYPNSTDVFPGVDIKGGVSYFLWDTNYTGKCEVVTIRNSQRSKPTERKLDEFDVFLRDPQAPIILRKVLALKEPPITKILSRDTPFGIATNFAGFHEHERSGDVPLYYVKNGRKIGYMPRSKVPRNSAGIDTWKVFVAKAGSGANQIPDYVLSSPWSGNNPSVCTQTFLYFAVEREREREQASNRT